MPNKPKTPSAKSKAAARPSASAIEIKRLIAIGRSGRDLDPNAPPAKRPMTEDEYRDWRRRTVAELISLPAMCPVRRCRRSRRCKGDEALCLERHREMAGARVNLMMGWDLTSLTDEEDDLSW